MEKLNVLLVDDKEENLIALEALIRRDDLEIYQTTDPNQGLKLAWEKDISLALIDVQMPGMDGFELAGLLKNNPKTRDMLILFVTAISKESRYAVKGFNSGAVDYLYKPLDPYVTAAKVDALVQLARARRELVRKNEELANYALEIFNSADIICRIDPRNLRILSVNPAVTEVLGYKPNEVLGRNILDLTAGNGESLCKFELEKLLDSSESSAVFNDRFVNFRKDIQWLECRVKKTGEMLLLNMSDITVQKNYTNELIRSKEVAEESKKIKESFLANMSHEIRTPLNGIISLTRILKDTTLNPEQAKMLNLISVSSQSLLGVINDILDFSKIEAGKFSIVRSETNLPVLLETVCEILRFKADEKNIILSCHIGNGVPDFILADSLRLNQILMNLLGNAVKFTESGEVRLTVKVSERTGDKATLAFIVEDTGIGIPYDKLEHIFDPFSQAENDTSSRFGGTGLGLSITKKLADLKGGKLTVNSMLGKGSVFTFINTFTVLAKPALADKPVEMAIEPFAKAPRVLMAEDNKINQFAAQLIMKKWNVDLDIAETGKQAVEKFEAGDYDLILMDIYMPEMNGYDATRYIRENGVGNKKKIPIIALSAAVLETEMSEAVYSGVDDIVSKPFNPQLLYTKMRLLIEGYRKG